MINSVMVFGINGFDYLGHIVEALASFSAASSTINTHFLSTSSQSCHNGYWGVSSILEEGWGGAQTTFSLLTLTQSHEHHECISIPLRRQHKQMQCK